MIVDAKHEAATLTDAEWQELEELLAASSYLPVVQKLRQVHNCPMTAEALFGYDNAWSGDDRINDALRRRGAKFMVARVAPFVEGETRRQRMLALVRK